MVKRSRSAAQLPSDAHADLVLDNVDPPIVQEPSEAHGVELIEDARTHRPAINRTVDAEPPLVASGSSFTSATCALGESNRIKSPQSNYQLFDRTLSSVVAATKVELKLMTINVQMLSGPLPPITISADAEVHDLKMRLHTLYSTLNADFAFNRQKLLIHEPGDAGSDILLLNHQKLKSYEITESTTVVLFILPSPGIEVWIDDALKDTHRFFTN